MDLNVISFNIRYKDDPDGNAISQRAPRLKTVLDRYEADLIGLQECSPQWMPWLQRFFGEEYEIFNQYRSRENPESCPMLWKKDAFRCLKKGWFWYSDTPDVESRGWDELYNCYRICQWTVLEHQTSGKRFCWMNTHFGFGDTCQRDSVDLLYRRSREISEYPVFATGDFNIFPHYPAYRQITSYFTDVNMATVRDTRNTFHGYSLTENLEERIDYCFVDSRITPLDYKRIDDLVDGKFPSDHYGIQAKIKL